MGEEQLVENMIVAISFYERTLLTKSFVSLLKKDQRKKDLKSAGDFLAKKSQWELMRSKMTHWLSIFRQRRRRKDAVFKALNHWGSKTQQKILKGLRYSIML